MKIERKLYAVVLVSILLAAGILSTIATRTITDTGDTVDTFIRNSKGHYWTATGANLQLAIYDLNSTFGGEVYVPQCNITITTPIKLINGLNILGTGNGTKLFLGNAANCYILLISNKNNITITNIFLHGNNASQTGYYSGAINITGTSSFITIDKCIIVKCAGTMINIGGAAFQKTHDITIKDCYFNRITKTPTKYPSAIRIYGYNNKILHNYIQDSYACGICIESEDVLANGDHTGYRNIIDGNIITGFTGVGIDIEPEAGAVFDKGSNTSVTNNIIYNLNSTAYLVSESSYSEGINCGSFCFIAFNTIEKVHKYGIYNHGNYSLILGNNIKNVSGGSGSAGFGISTDTNSRHVKIMDNNINNTRYAIYVASKGTHISGNDIDYTRQHAIYLDAGSDYSKIVFNTIKNAVSSCIDFTADIEKCTVIGNTFDTNTYDQGALFLRSAKNTTVSQNTFISCDKGIVEWAGANFNNINGNNLIGATTKLTVVGAKTIVLYNLGAYSIMPLVNITSGGIYAGFMWYSASANKLYVYDGSAWDEVSFT